jgi:multidrug resistance efflux pump
MKPKWWMILLILALAVVGLGWYVGSSPQTRAEWLKRVGLAPKESGWVASGFIEAEQVSIAPEMAGRVVELPFAEGDEVHTGDLLLRLEDDLLSAQVELARGKLEEAEATLAQVKAGARKEMIHKVAAQLALAEAARDGAKQAWLDARAIRDNPQTLNVQIAAAQAQAMAAQKQYEAALLQRDLAEEAWKNYGKAVGTLAKIPVPYRPAMPPAFYLVPYQWEQALAATNVAQADYEGARTALNHLLEQRANPQETQAQVDAAYARYQSAEAAVAKVQAAFDEVKSGATKEQIAAAQAQVAVAQAALESSQVQLDKVIVRAPRNGVIVARSVYTGEMASPGIIAMTLADLNTVSLTIYVPGKQLGEMALGQQMDVRVDAFAERVFPSTVIHVSDKAEYTPRSVRTPDERASLVYAVKLKIANPDHALKPGMPADAQVTVTR